MRIDEHFAPRAIIVLVVFPLLIGVLGGITRLAGSLIIAMVRADAPWRDGLVVGIDLVGLAAGAAGAFVVCRRIWPRDPA